MPSPALDSLDSSGIGYRVIRHGPVRSLAEAANARGVEPADVVKTMVVRRGEGDYVFVRWTSSDFAETTEYQAHRDDVTPLAGWL